MSDEQLQGFTLNHVELAESRYRVVVSGRHSVTHRCRRARRWGQRETPTIGSGGGIVVENRPFGAWRPLGTTTGLRRVRLLETHPSTSC